MGRVDVSGLRIAVQQYAEEVARLTAERALDEVRPNVPIGEQQPGSTRAPGELRASEFNRTAGTTISIGYSAEHASYTDEGTAPHRIDGNPLLAFYWEGSSRADGLTILPFVDHPGTARQGWWSDVIGTEDDGYAGLVRIANEVAAEVTVTA